jgi:hypothetical protein
MGDLEFRPQRSYRNRLLKGGCIGLGIAVACLVMRALFGRVAGGRFEVFAAAWFLLAAWSLVSYAWGARFRTRLTPRGIEVHRYVTRLLPWDTIRDIKVVNSNQTRRDGGPKRGTVSVQVVRHRGRDVRLPAPIVAGGSSGPEFDHQVEQLKQHWRLGVAGQPVVPPVSNWS